MSTTNSARLVQRLPTYLPTKFRPFCLSASRPVGASSKRSYYSSSLQWKLKQRLTSFPGSIHQEPSSSTEGHFSHSSHQSASRNKRSPANPIDESSSNPLKPPDAAEEPCKDLHKTEEGTTLKQSRGYKSESSPVTPSESLHANDPSSDTTGRNLENYSHFFRRLALSLPQVHRPTRDDFLNVANGYWQRARVRFKWFTIKSFRKFNADDISAFVTWFLMSQTLWILIGTTTFFSVIFATANSLRLQHYLARAISDYLTSETGVTIVFESAIVPKWKDSRISFKNVYISRRPSLAQTVQSNKNAAAHVAAVGYDVHNHPAYHRVGDDEEITVTRQDHSEDDVQWSMFDLNVDSIDVTLSLWRWLDGKGLVEDAVVKGVRGILDRRTMHWDYDHPLDPASFRHRSRPGDFELESLQLEDVLITVYQPGNFRPYTASIFRADLGCLRKQWLFYDFLSAENIVGQFDNCLFSLHKPQSIGRTTDRDLKDEQWSKMSRIRIDGVNIDHLRNSTTQEGPISWITSGKLDAVLDIKFPRDPDSDLALNALLGEIADAISISLERIPGQRELAKPPLTVPPEEEKENNDKIDERKVVVDIDLRFRDLKAAVPIFTNDLSYVNNALVRPIVVFMNTNRTLVPVRCRVVKDLSDFDGSWTIWETGLVDEIAYKTYDALAYHVTQANMNRRIKTIGVWSLQMTASAVLSAIRNVIDPTAASLKELYLNGLPYGVVLDAAH